MKLFSFKKTVSANLAADLIQCLSGQNVLEQGAKTAIIAIKNKVSVPSDIFQILYTETLKRVAALCQALPCHENQALYSLLNCQIEQCLSALQLRQGLLLPLNTGAEIMAEQEAQWTYAIFSAGLLYQLANKIQAITINLYNQKRERIGHWHPLLGRLDDPEQYFSVEWKPILNLPESSLSTVLAIQLIPQSAIRWLMQNTAIVTLWWEALTLPCAKNLIADLILKANTDNFSEIKSEQNNTSINDKIDVIETPKSANVVNLESLLNWLNDYQNQTFDNEPLVFRVKEGLFINHKLLTQYLSQEETTNMTLKQFIEQIKSYLYLGKNHYNFDFCPIAFEDRRTFSGIIVKAEYLTTEWRQLAVTKHYTFTI